MYARTARMVIIASILALSAVCALGEAAYRAVEKPGAFVITGAANNVDPLRESLEITDQGNTYTVLTGKASVQLETGKVGATQNLKNNAYIQVTGEQLSARTILASSIVVLDEKTAPQVSTPQGYQPNDRIETSGTVTGLTASSGEVDIRTDGGNYALVVKTETVIRRYIYVTDINDINEGDGVSVTGRMGRDGRIIAERIQVSAPGDKRVKPSATKGYRPTYLGAVSHSQEDSIEGAIVSAPTSFDRTLSLNTEYGERKVDVLKTAEVRINQVPASVHELTKGDRVRVFGTWDSSTMVATRVETYVPSATATYRAQELPAEPEPVVVPDPATQPENPSAEITPAPADPPAAAETVKASTLTGRIVAIDSAKLGLTVDAALKDNNIGARDAAITRKGAASSFTDLKKGDKVEVKGDWNGDVLKATSVDVVE